MKRMSFQFNGLMAKLVKTLTYVGKTYRSEEVFFINGNSKRIRCFRQKFLVDVACR